MLKDTLALRKLATESCSITIITRVDTRYSQQNDLARYKYYLKLVFVHFEIPCILYFDFDARISP